MNDSEVESRRETSGDVFTNVRIRRPMTPKPRWLRILRNVGQLLAAVIFLAAGTVWTLRMQHPPFTQPRALLHLPPALITPARPWEQTLAPQPTDPHAN